MLASLLFSMAVDAEVANGLRNLAQLHQVALSVELTRTSGQDAPAGLPPDVWGTPYRIEGTRVTSAGSDKKFEDKPKPGQFAGTEGDIVIENGAVVRSNRNWLHARAKSSEDATAALDELRESELTFMRMHMPVLRDLTLAQMTMKAMVRGNMDHDAWGTPFRVEGPRTISAGADRKFDPASWSREPETDVAEDIIAENGQITRTADPQATLREHLKGIEPIEQPVDERLTVDASYRRVGDPGVPEPVSIHRPEPPFPDAYRRAGIRGIVMLEMAISKEGKVEDVRLLKSLAPDLDGSALETVRQWTFEPVLVDGKPVPVIKILPVAFMLH